MEPQQYLHKHEHFEYSVRLQKSLCFLQDKPSFLGGMSLEGMLIFQWLQE